MTQNTLKSIFSDIGDLYSVEQKIALRKTIDNGLELLQAFEIATPETIEEIKKAFTPEAQPGESKKANPGLTPERIKEISNTLDGFAKECNNAKVCFFSALDLSTKKGEIQVIGAHTDEFLVKVHDIVCSQIKNS